MEPITSYLLIQVIGIVLLEGKTMKELKKVNLNSYKTVSRNNSEENPKNRRQGLRDRFWLKKLTKIEDRKQRLI